MSLSASARYFAAFVLLSAAARASQLDVIFYDNRFGTIDTSTGAYSQISTLPIGKAAGIASSNGSFYVEDLANNLLLVDPVTGASRVLGNTGLGLNLFVFAGGDSGLYGIDHASNLYSFNSQNGTAALIGNTGLNPNNGQFDTSLSFDGTSLLYTAGRAGSKDEVYQISLATGIATDLGSTGIPGIAGSAFSDGKLDLFQYGQLANYMYTAADGSITFSKGAALGATIVDGGVPASSVSTVTSARTPTPVPESGTMITAASGLMALAFVVRPKPPCACDHPITRVLRTLCRPAERPKPSNRTVRIHIKTVTPDSGVYTQWQEVRSYEIPHAGIAATESLRSSHRFRASRVGSRLPGICGQQKEGSRRNRES